MKKNEEQLYILKYCKYYCIDLSKKKEKKRVLKKKTKKKSELTKKKKKIVMIRIIIMREVNNHAFPAKSIPKKKIKLIKIM